MFIPLIRTIILYTFVIIAVRLMGKRQIAEMQPTELVITILISAVASVPMQNPEIPLTHGIVPIFTLISAEIFISFLSSKFPRFRKVLTGKPVILIENGIINQNALKSTRLSIDDLYEELRLNNTFNIADIRRAQLETNGQLSILLFDKKQPLTPEDLELKISPSAINYIVIADGYIDNNVLKLLKKDRKWLTDELEKRGINNTKDVFLMLCDSSSQTTIIKKEKK